MLNSVFRNRSLVVRNQILTEARSIPGDACQIRSTQNTASLCETVNLADQKFTDARVAVLSFSSSDDKAIKLYYHSSRNIKCVI